VWLFGLQGTLGEIAPARAATGTAAPAMPPRDRVGDVANGQRIYKTACVFCHGERGQGGEGGGKAIARNLGVDGVLDVLAKGRNQMPAFTASLTPDQLHDVATYVDRRLLAPVAAE
jgi:mono/diheme cytochrome c family protein